MRRNSELKCGPAESDQTAGAGQAAEPDKTAESGQTAGGAAFSAGREFAKYTFLNVLGMFGLSCYILADTFFVSKGLGTNGLAALNLAIPIYSIVHGSGLMLGMGGATKYSIFRGQRAWKHGDGIFTNTLYLAAVLAVCFLVAGAFFSGGITGLLRADGDVAEMTRTYLRIILLFSPAFLLNDILVCFVRNDGNPRLSMAAMLSGSISNIFLDYLFIFPMQMGIFGAVLATGFAPIISILVLSGHWAGRKKGFHLKRNQFSPAMSGTCISLGIPSLVTEVSSGVVMIVFNMITLSLAGNVGVAAYGVIANLSLVVIAVFTGIAQGMQPVISRAYGKADRSTVKQVLCYGVLTVVILSIVVYAGMFLFADAITGIFNSENNVRLQEIAGTGIRLYFIASPFAGINIVLSTCFTSTERAIPAQVLSVVRGFALIIPVTCLLALAAGLTGVWLAFPITEGIVCAAGGAVYRRST